MTYREQCPGVDAQTASSNPAAQRGCPHTCPLSPHGPAGETARLCPQNTALEKVCIRVPTSTVPKTVVGRERTRPLPPWLPQGGPPPPRVYQIAPPIKNNSHKTQESYSPRLISG